MIRIHRTSPAPGILTRLGSLQTVRDCAAYEEAPEEYAAGCRRFSYKDYYSHPSVKATLRKMHHDKCCYCETKVSSSANLDVEHFRPKGEVRQSREAEKEFPGYYWLVYCWENLLLACADCNRTHKGAIFPLANPAQRARSHNHDLTKEQERFVDPTAEDPRDHIRFDGDLPVARTERGCHTIAGLGLRRSTLNEERLRLLNKVRVLIDVIKITTVTDLQGSQEDIRKLIEVDLQPDAKFSSMVRDYVTRRGL